MTFKVLIVDDSKFSRALSRHYIEVLRSDAQISEAVDGTAALHILDTDPPDIAIIDNNMPGLSGLDLIRELRKKWPDMKVALLTANIQQGMRDRAEHLHVHFFSKPITETVIADILTTLLTDS